ncbi:MAG: S-layer homology domain-containing protein [Candidatus Peregrinibacteria bacterium]
MFGAPTNPKTESAPSDHELAERNLKNQPPDVLHWSLILPIPLMKILPNLLGVLCTLCPASMLLLASAGFPDIPSNHENFDAISYVQKENIVSGYPDGTYRPDKEINRAEFTKILVGSRFSQEQIIRCMLDHQQEDVFFPDVLRTTWYGPYVCIAKAENIVQGYPDGTFKPEGNINFAEAAKIVTKTFFETQQDPGAGVWFASYVQELSNRKSIPLSIRKFDSLVRRGEMAEIIYRLKTSAEKPSQTYEQLAENSSPKGNTQPTDETQERCSAGWACKDSAHRAFRKLDCSWKLEETCGAGCEAGQCRGSSCTPTNCPDSCSGNTRHYNGQCINGTCQYTSVECAHGCENGLCLSETTQDPCSGVTCPDHCSGNTRYHSGHCTNGECQYSAQQCSNACVDGQCVTVDPCARVTCADSCENGTRRFDGSCTNGQCQYSTQQCTYGCSGDECKKPPASFSCQWVWPQKVINGTTNEMLFTCNGQRPYCKLGYPYCCRYNDAVKQHVDCVNCENGDCNPGATCEATKCPGVSCEGEKRHYGVCHNGACSDVAEACAYGCVDGYCVINPIKIFVTSQRYFPNMGGINGADAHCQTAASTAGLSGTWKALISTSGVNAVDRIPNGVYVRMDGKVIASSKADLFDGSIDVPIDKTEYGADAAAYTYPWTASDQVGKYTGPVNEYFPYSSCVDWTQTNGCHGYVGLATATDKEWINHTLISCVNDSELYCVQVMP